MAKTKRTPYTSKRWTTWFNKKCDALHRTGFQEFLENEKKIDLINKVKETIFDSAYLEFIRVKKPLHHSGTTIIVKRLKKVTTPDERLDSLWQRIYDAAEINDSTLRIRFRNYLEDEGFEEYDLRNMLLNKRTLSSHLAGFYQSE